MRTLDTIAFKEFGQGYYGWMTAINSAVIRMANNFGISLLFYSEDGEIEYGGGTEYQYEGVYGIDYMKRAYLNDNILTAQLPDSELKELLATLLDQSSPHSMSFEDLPVEETMKSFFQNPQDYL